MESDVLGWIGMAICAGGSFFFALAETSLLSLGRWRVIELAARAPERGRLVEGVLNAPQELLGAIVLGNTAANAGIVGLAYWIGWKRPGWLWPMLGAALALVLLGCEVLPKTLAVRSPAFWAMRTIVPVTLFLRWSGPLRRLAVRLDSFLADRLLPDAGKAPLQSTDEEYGELIELAYAQGALDLSEKQLISEIIRLDRRTAKEVMKPRAQMVSISDDLSQEEMAEIARRERRRRLPIYDETPDTIVGILNTRALLLNPDIDLSEAIEFPSYVPETMNLLQMLKSMQRQKRGMVIVLDEYGGTAGLVTQEDILEAVIGELRREGEPEERLLEALGEGRWRVQGTLRLDDFRRQCYPALEEAPEVETAAGLVISRKEVVPAPGESVVFSGLRWTVQSSDERRVREILVEVVPKKGAEA